MPDARYRAAPVRAMSEQEAKANRKWLSDYSRRVATNKQRQDDTANFHLRQARLYRMFAEQARTPGVQRYWTVAAVNAETKYRELLACP